MVNSTQKVSCCLLAELCLTLGNPMDCSTQASLSFTVSWSLLKLIFIESVMLSSHLILCCPLLLPSIFFSIRIFSSESALHIRWPKYWSFSFIISPSNEYSGLISFRIDRLDLLAVQGTLKSLLQPHSSKASINSSVLSLLYSPTPYMTTEKPTALIIWTFVRGVIADFSTVKKKYSFKSFKTSRRMIYSTTHWYLWL